jgi:hypothetical protein
VGTRVRPPPHWHPPFRGRRLARRRAIPQSRDGRVRFEGRPALSSFVQPFNLKKIFNPGGTSALPPSGAGVVGQTESNRVKVARWPKIGEAEEHEEEEDATLIKAHQG